MHYFSTYVIVSNGRTFFVIVTKKITTQIILSVRCLVRRPQGACINDRNRDVLLFNNRECFHKSKLAGLFSRGETTINKHFTFHIILDSAQGLSSLV